MKKGASACMINSKDCQRIFGEWIGPEYKIYLSKNFSTHYFIHSSQSEQSNSLMDLWWNDDLYKYL